MKKWKNRIVRLWLLAFLIPNCGKKSHENEDSGDYAINPSSPLETSGAQDSSGALGICPSPDGDDDNAPAEIVTTILIEERRVSR